MGTLQGGTSVLLTGHKSNLPTDNLEFSRLPCTLPAAMARALLDDVTMDMVLGNNLSGIFLALCSLTYLKIYC